MKKNCTGNSLDSTNNSGVVAEEDAQGPALETKSSRGGHQRGLSNLVGGMPK